MSGGTPPHETPPRGAVNITARPVQLRGSRLAGSLLRLAGWQVRFDGLPARQGVMIVYPHTSNWDFIVGLLAKWSIGLPVTFWGKDSLFRLPLFGHWMRWIGGLPVDRDARNGLVGQMTEALVSARANDRFLWLALSPEGTRSRTDGWRSGFYHVARAAAVPLALVGFDYARRVVDVDRFVGLGGEVAADMAAIAAAFGNPVGRHPAGAAPIRLRT